MKGRITHLVLLFSMLLVCAFAGHSLALDPALVGEDVSVLPVEAVQVKAQSPVGRSAAAATWHIEQVDTLNAGNYNSLALDAEGWPHISYYAHKTGDLKYAYKHAGGWRITTVDSAGTVGAFTSLALDDNGRPHISYCSCTDANCNTCSALKYARYDGSAWHIKIVDSGPLVGGYSSLVLVDNRPNISYYDYLNGNLKFARITMYGFPYRETVDDSAGDVGMFSSLAIHEGKRHISYYDLTKEDLRYAYYDGNVWQSYVLAEEGRVGLHTSLDICRSPSPGAPRITYSDGSKLGYAHKYIFGGWTMAALEDVATGPTSLFLDSSCRVHVSYFNLYTGKLLFTYQGISGLVTETVDDYGDPGSQFSSSLVLDANGNPFISYYDVNHDALSFAYRSTESKVYLPVLLGAYDE